MKSEDDLLLEFRFKGVEFLSLLLHRLLLYNFDYTVIGEIAAVSREESLPSDSSVVKSGKFSGSL